MRRGLSNPKQTPITFLKASNNQSSPFFQLNRKQQPSNLLENEAQKMTILRELKQWQINKKEDKLNQLKQAMNKEKNKREDNMRTSGSRWKTATTEQPIKNYANKVLDKQNSTVSQQTSNLNTSKSIGKPPALKIGNLTKTDSSKATSTIPKRPTNIVSSRPTSTQSQRSALNRSLTGKENENNLNSSFRKTVNQSFESQEQQSSMTQFSTQTANKDEEQSVKSSSTSLQNSGIMEKSEQQEKGRTKKMAQTKLNELFPAQVNAISQKQSKAVNNLFKHLSYQKELQKEVHQFLSSLNLLQYQAVFEENGFDDLETIQEISTEYMNSMKIPAGHQIKIQKRIDFLKEEAKKVEDLHKEKELKDQQPESSKVKNITLYPNEKRTDLEELEPPIDEQDQYDSNYKFSYQTSTTTTTATTAQGGGELLQGNFNEEESHKSFLEALMEFRNQIKKPIGESITEEDNSRANLSTADQRKKSVRFAEGVLDNEREHTIRMAKKQKDEDSSDGTIRGFAKNSIQPPIEQNQQQEEDMKDKPAKNAFFYSTGNEDWSNDAFPYSVDVQTGTDPSQGRKPKRDIDKISCWNCYKVVPLGTEKTFNIKNFCSTKCLSVYQGSSYITCLCGKQELKDEATFVKATWFCSEVCALDLKDTPQVLKNLQNKYKEIDNLNAIDKGIDNDIDENNSNEGNGDDIDLDFGDTNTTTTKVLTLQELEQKYKDKRIASPQKNNKQKKK